MLLLGASAFPVTSKDNISEETGVKKLIETQHDKFLTKLCSSKDDLPLICCAILAKKTVTAPKGSCGLLDVLFFYILQVLVRTKKKTEPPCSLVPALLRPLCLMTLKVQGHYSRMIRGRAGGNLSLTAKTSLFPSNNCHMARHVSPLFGIYL